MDEKKLKNIFQNQLENHETHFDTDGLYEGIVAKRKDKKKRRFLPLIFFGMTCLLALAYVLPRLSSEDNDEKEVVIEIEEEISAQNLVSKDGVVENDFIAKKETQSANQYTNINTLKKERAIVESAQEVVAINPSVNDKSTAYTSSTTDSNTEGFNNSSLNTQEENVVIYNDSNTESRLENNVGLIGINSVLNEKVNNNTVSSKIPKEENGSSNKEDLVNKAIIPFSLGTLKQIQVPLFEGNDMSYDLPLLNNKKDIDSKLRLGIYSSIFKTNRKLQNDDIGASDIRNDREKQLEAIAFSLSVQKPVFKHFFIEAGIEYLIINEIFENSSTTKSTEFIAARSVFTAETIRKRIYNSHKIIEIPLGIGVEKRIGNWYYNLSASANVNLSLRSEGQIMLEENSFVRVNNDDLFKKRIGLNYAFRAGVGYQINDITICLNTRLKRYVNSFTQNGIGKQTYDLYGGELGVVYRW